MGKGGGVGEKENEFWVWLRPLQGAEWGKMGQGHASCEGWAGEKACGGGEQCGRTHKKSEGL